jgi:DNA-binding NarL/FixJ family response regulator
MPTLEPATQRPVSRRITGSAERGSLSITRQAPAPEARDLRSVLVVERQMLAEAMGEAIHEASTLRVSAWCRYYEEITELGSDVASDIVAIDVDSTATPDEFAVIACAAVDAAREHAAGGRVVLMAPDLDPQRFARALAAGAAHCISACVGRSRFVKALEAAASNPVGFEDTLAELLTARPRGPNAASEAKSLSERELEVVGLAARGSSVADIARQLVISDHTVRTHLRRIYGKLGATNRAGAVAAAIRKGLIH